MLVGAGGAAALVTVTEALARAVAPPAPVATTVNVVFAVTVTVREPFVGTDEPLMVAAVALVVCQLTSAVFEDCIAA